MEIGKLTNEQLKKSVLDLIGKNKREETVVGAGIGIDSAVLNLGGDLCVLSTDPITAENPDAGTLAIYVSVNDIAAAGATPIAVLITLMCPSSSSIDDIEKVVRSAKKAADKVNVDIVGGHTEITDAVNRIVLCVTAVGKKKGVKINKACVGDAVLLTGYAGSEGSFILKDTVDLNEADKIDLNIIKDALDVSLAAALAGSNGANAMHDVTEGGILGAAYELAEASDAGIEIYLDNIPVLGLTKKICKKLDLDVFRLISSGCLLISVDKTNKDKVMSALKSNGIVVNEIGVVIKNGYIKRSGGIESKIDPPEKDQLFTTINKRPAF